MRPEDYWIGLGENVIGLDVQTEQTAARQAPTYQNIAETIVGLGVNTVLDVGCNVAALYTFLLMQGYRGSYLGIDSNPHAVEVAQHYATARDGNLRALEYGDLTFECVVVKDVIEHLEGLDPLREAFRVAQKYVILAVYLPFTITEPIIVKKLEGYYTNAYLWADVRALAKACSFRWIKRTWPEEANGWQNEVVVWERRK